MIYQQVKHLIDNNMVKRVRENYNIIISISHSYSVNSVFLFCLACNPNPCQNNGVCAGSTNDGTAKCTCVGGYSGDICDVPAAGKTFNYQ